MPLMQAMRPILSSNQSMVLGGTTGVKSDAHVDLPGSVNTNASIQINQHLSQPDPAEFVIAGIQASSDSQCQSLQGRNESMSMLRSFSNSIHEVCLEDITPCASANLSDVKKHRKQASLGDIAEKIQQADDEMLRQRTNRINPLILLTQGLSTINGFDSLEDTNLPLIGISCRQELAAQLACALELSGRTLQNESTLVAMARPLDNSESRQLAIAEVLYRGVSPDLDLLADDELRGYEVDLEQSRLLDFV